MTKTSVSARALMTELVNGRVGESPSKSVTGSMSELPGDRVRE